MTQTYRTALPWFVTEFFDEMDNNPDDYGPDVWNVRKNVIEKAFREEYLEVDTRLADKYFSLERYFPFRLLPYQHCAIGLWLCVFNKENHTPRWDTLFIMGGRGLGKDGIIAFSSFCLTSPYNPVPNYDVDICANNEEQAVRPVQDIAKNVLESPKTKTDGNKLKSCYKWTKEMVHGKLNGGTIKGRTNNPKGRDGMRSGCVVFNELHQYENYNNINVFRTGLGKTKEPRTLMVTTNGYVIDGVLDNYLERAGNVLSGENPDNGWLPFLFRLNSEEDVKDPSKWIQANPRLKHAPELLQEIRNEFEDYKVDPDKNTSFPTKRMNFRRMNMEQAVTSWENILATNREIPDLTGYECVAGIDFSKTSDWTAVNLHFKVGEERYDINHAFVCIQGDDFAKLNCPHEEWRDQGLITYINSPDISPQIVQDYLQRMSRKYNIKCLAIDFYRWTLLSDFLGKLGFSQQNKNLFMVRPSNIMRVVPKIDSLFRNQHFHWGDNPVLRWATNNTKLIPAKKTYFTDEENVMNGNYLYAKIEPVKRKTDPFMALVASMCVEDRLTDFIPSSNYMDIGALIL